MESKPPRKRARTDGRSTDTSVKDEKECPDGYDAFLLSLLKTKVEELDIGKPKIITANREESVYDVIQKIAKHNILSVPILKRDDRYYGFVDVLDMITFVLCRVGEGKIPDRSSISALNASLKDTTVNDIMKYPVSKLNPFHPMRSGSSLFSVLEELASGVHRIPIIDANESLVNVITQSRVIHWIHQHMKQSASLKQQLQKKSVSSLGDCYQYVISVKTTAPVIEAFQLIKSQRVGAVAVVDANDSIIGSVSAREIKRIVKQENFLERLWETAETFCKDEKGAIKYVGTVSESDTLDQVIQILDEHQLHRVYIVDEKKHIIGVISLTDLLRVLLP